MRKKGRYNPSRTSPRGSRRACLCPDGTYSRKCCKGNMINQGIGNIGRAETPTVLGDFNNDFNNDFNK